MSDKLKKFIKDHKQEFDTSEPRNDLWEKIDAGLETVKPQWIRSKWLKYFGFSASALVLVAYIVYNSQNSSLVQKNDLSINNSITNENSKENPAGIGKTETISNKVNETTEYPMNAGDNLKKNVSITVKNEEKIKHQDSLQMYRKDTLAAKTEAFIEKSAPGGENTVSSLVYREESNKKENKFPPVKRNEDRNKEITEADSYSCTIWENASFCSMIRTFKFPGKVSVEGKTKTVGCNDLSNKGNMEAVWLKGRTSKKITLSLEEGFKNIFLVKKDGRHINPYAISHYYPGLGVISNYSGKYFDLFFNDKVEMILFFPDIEEGDRILIDDKIEASIKSKP